MLLSRQEYVDMYATSMKDRLLAAARAKAKELQQEAAVTIDKIDKGIKGEGASPAPDDHGAHDDHDDHGAHDDHDDHGAQDDHDQVDHGAHDDHGVSAPAPDSEGRPPTSQGDERAAS
jgi:hypothetical protein